MGQNLACGEERQALRALTARATHGQTEPLVDFDTKINCSLYQARRTEKSFHAVMLQISTTREINYWWVSGTAFRVTRLK
jgi:hypothetical protein